jgi:hypothetical protein
MNASASGLEGPPPFVIAGPPRPASGTRAALARRVPVIHVFANQKAWMAGTSPAMTIRRVKPGHDEHRRGQILTNDFLKPLHPFPQRRGHESEMTNFSVPGARR